MPLVPLPIDQALPELLAKLRAARSAVLVAPPGAGKTTRVPPAILRSGLLSAEHPNIVMLQPRRVAARAAASRIAAEQGWAVGEDVGYHVRFDRKLSARSRIRVLTEGILTRQLLDDPGLDGIGAVLLDEFHERSLHTDIAIALLREVQESLRPDLMLIVMSATLSAEPVAKFLSDAPIVRSEGRMFPIGLRYAQKPMPPAWAVDEVPRAVAELLTDSNDDGGDVLVFLPGMEEIRRTQRRLESDLQALVGSALADARQIPFAKADPARPLKIATPVHVDDLLILPLHGSLTADEQDLALRPSERRKIILATNIAETSLTIEGVTNVIDTGLARLASYDAERGLDRLDLCRISRASAEQRAGRSGRTAPGRCVRLWSEKEHHALAAFETPEIRRVDLAGTALSLHAWGVNPRTFGWFEQPSEASIDTAEELLEMLGALERPTKNVGWAPPTTAGHAAGKAHPTSNAATSSRETGELSAATINRGPSARAANVLPARITPLGKQMVNLPMHPRLARLLVAAQSVGLAKEGAALAAMLSEKDILPFAADRDARRASVTGDSDVLYRLQRLESGDRSLDHAAVRQVNAARHQFLKAVENGERHTPSPRRGEGGSEGRDVNRRAASAARESIANDRRGTPTEKVSPHDSERSAPHSGPLLAGERELDLLKLILLAYPDRVCERRSGDPTQAVMVGGGGVRIGTESIVSNAPFFVAVDARHDNFSNVQQAVVRIASRVEPAWLEELFPQSIRRETTAEYDEQRGKVVGIRRTLYRDLPLSENVDGVVDDEAAARVLARIIRPRVTSLLKDDEHLAPLVARLQLLAEHMPEHPWPRLEEMTSPAPETAAGPLAVSHVAPGHCAKPQANPHGATSTNSDSADDWIVRACLGARTLDEAKRKLPNALREQLVYPLDRLLDQHAPETVEVPTGNRIKIDYKPGQRPVLAVRLQEVFGWLDTPRIANGRVPLLMHLLGPNYRPVQITDDLRSFWSGTYFQVRKDLKVRYPKHAWPDDPLTATPQAKGRPRK